MNLKINCWKPAFPSNDGLSGVVTSTSSVRWMRGISPVELNGYEYWLEIFAEGQYFTIYKNGMSQMCQNIKGEKVVLKEHYFGCNYAYDFQKSHKISVEAFNKEYSQFSPKNEIIDYVQVAYPEYSKEEVKELSRVFGFKKTKSLKEAIETLNGENHSKGRIPSCEAINRYNLCVGFHEYYKFGLSHWLRIALLPHPEVDDSANQKKYVFIEEQREFCYVP